jgi:hypothetical protein
MIHDISLDVNQAIVDNICFEACKILKNKKCRKISKQRRKTTLEDRKSRI